MGVQYSYFQESKILEAKRSPTLVARLELEEIIRESSLRNVWVSRGQSVLLWSRLKLNKRILQILIYFHDCRCVATSVAVVWGREQGHHSLVV